MRPLWFHYLNNINGLIWAYDIINNLTIEESQKELKKILDDLVVNNIPLLIFANKSDLNTNGNKVEYFLDGIQDCLNNRPFFVKECNINHEQSYQEGIDWLYSNLK